MNLYHESGPICIRANYDAARAARWSDPSYNRQHCDKVLGMIDLHYHREMVKSWREGHKDLSSYLAYTREGYEQGMRNYDVLRQDCTLSESQRLSATRTYRLYKFCVFLWNRKKN